ncbi:MAG: CARDB domain-containing protein, partial [Armatimonadota bacterium]|nr:CARDB domain-containing protein [Armatimonadota bacterium]
VASWTNPNAPQFDTQVRITISGNFAYLAVSEYRNGLIVLDLSDLPNRITKVASFTGRSCHHASTSGNLVYLAADDGLYVLRNLLMPQVLPPTIFAVSPRTLTTISDVTLRVEGANFQSGAQVWLERSNQRLNPTRATIVGGNIIYAQFDLSSATLGRWDVVVRNPDGNIARRSEAVTIAQAPDLTLANLRLEPSANLQDGTPVNVKVTARNTGGIGANFVVRFLAGSQIIGEETVSLAGGAEAEVSLPWRIIAGNYQIRAIADPANAVLESNEANNEATLPINLPSPDLTVTSLTISPSSNLVDGQEVQVQVVIANQGSGTSRPIALKFLVDEGNYGEQTISEGLGTNRSQTITFRHSVSAGQRQISIVVDPANTVPETNETNNRRDLSLPEIPRPDVAITNLRTFPSTNLSPGMNIQIIATIHNFGGATARQIAIAFDAAGSNLTNWTAGLGANESKEIEVTWRNIPAGQHRILATVDPYNALPDLNRANNQATTIVEVTPPDFVVEGMEIRPSRAVSGATVTVVAFIRISGVGRTPFPIPVRLYDNDVPASEAQIEAGIPAGQRLALRMTYRAMSGQRRLKVVVDPDNRVSEPNETNNSAEQTLDVPAPDVALNVALVPDNPQTGQTFFVRGIVRNNGETTTVPFTVVAEVFDENNRTIASNRQDFSEGMAGGASRELNLSFTRFFEMKRVRVKVNWGLSGFQDSNPANEEAIFNLPDVAPPDFALTNIDVQLPAIVGMGRTITFRVSVTNRGGNYRLTAFGRAGIPIFIFLNDQHIATTFFGDLDSNATTTTSASWVIDRPFTNPTIRAVIDPNRLFPDSDRTNNEAQRQIEATVQKLDLVPLDVQINPANQPVGSWVYVQVRVRKEGVGDYYGRVPVRVFVDEERLDNLWAQALLTDTNPETVISLGWNVKPGSERNVRVVLDPENVVDEQNETNNTLDRTISYSAAVPDFVVEGFDYSPKENVRQGDLVVFTANIRNKGGAYLGGVPVRLRLNTGFERVITIYNLNANEVKTVRFAYWGDDGWRAVPGGDHQVTVDVDPYNQIPESDEANNRLAQLLPLVVAARPIIQFSWVSYPPSVVAPGGQFSLNWTLNNSGAQTVPVTVSVSGLPEGWAQVEPAAGTLPANGVLNGTVTVSIPSNWAEEREFSLTLQAQANGITVRSEERRFKIETRPRIWDLTPYDGSRFGSTTVEFTWYTQIPSTSEVFIKRPVDVNWQKFTGEPGTFHKVVVSGLRRNSTYLFYVRSVGPGGESRSEERRIFVTSAVSFDRSEYTAEVRRDYDQRLTVYVVNNDRVPHTIKAELVDNPYEDAPAGLLGEGTFDEPARLSPGQRLAITFAAHFQDAQRNDYTFRIRVRTLDEPTEQVDEATVKIRVRPPDVRIRIVQIAEDPLTMVKTFRVTNEGTDPATDLTIDPQGLAAEQVGMQPLIQHAYLAPGQSIEFKIYPILLPPDFRPFTLSDVSSARLTFENSVGSIFWNFRPFDLYIKVNGVEVGSLQNMIPTGVFTFNIPPQVILPPNQFGRSIANRMANSDIVPISQEEMQPIVQKLREGVTLKVSYANQSQQVPVQFLSARQAHGQFFAINKGPRTMRQEVAANHCTNSPRVFVTFNNGIINAQLEILKNNFNDAHWFNVSKFTLDICTKAFWVGVMAPDEATARIAADNKCNVVTKQTPKPNTVVVTLVGDGPPFKRGKPVRVRARVMGEGDISITAVQANFSNGDAPIVLSPVGGNIFEGTWVPTTVPSNVRVESDGSVIFPVTVTVIAQGCEQQATDSQATEVRIGRIKFQFTGITEIDPSELEQKVNIPDEPWLRWNWSPGQQKFIHFRGAVVDEEGRPIPAEVSVQFRFSPMGDKPMKIENQQVYSRDGSFIFTFPARELALREPGQLRAVFEAKSQEIPSLRAKKFISGVLLGEFQFKATKENYLFWEAEVRGRKEKEQPVKVSATAGIDVKEVEISVLALQLDENGRLTWKPLEGASVELLGSGVIRKTDRNGSLVWKVSEGGETVSINFYLVPELEIKAISVPRGYIAHPEAQGKIHIFIGSKNGFEVTTDKDGNLQAKTTKSGAFVVSDRRFKVRIVSGGGSLEGDIARPESGNPIAHTIVYHPPQAINEQVREVKLAIEDSEIELYKGELTFKVFKNAFIVVSKLGFREDVEPVPIDLVDINGVKTIPGIVKGKVQENLRPESGRPINGATVTAFVADQQKTTLSEGVEGPTAGRFILENLADNKETSDLSKPIVLPFLDFVEEFAHSFDSLAQLGYRRPHFREQDGFVDFNNQPIFRYRWDLRYETDKEKLQRILDSIRRADAALKYTAEVHPILKQYYKEIIEAYVDLVLFVASELKIFDRLAELLSVGKGVGKGVRLSQTARRYVKAEIEKFLRQQGGFYDPNLLDNYVDYVDDALRNHKGLTDQALDDIWQRVNAVSGQQAADAVKAALRNYRDDLSAATEAIVAQMKGDIVGYLKILLKRFGIKEYEPETDNPIDKAFFWMLDKVLDAVLNAVVQQFELNRAFSIESISAIADQITESIANGQLTIDRLFFQPVVDVGFRTLGRYEIRGSTEQAIKNIDDMRKGIDQYRNLYEVARAPFSKAIGAVKTRFQKFYESTAIMTGASPNPIQEFAFGFFETSADLTGSILDGVLPIGSAATVLLGSGATLGLKISVPLAWIYAVGWSPSNLPRELISPFVPLPIERGEYYAPFSPFPIERSPLLAYVNAGGSPRFAPIRSRSRQLSEYETVVNQIKLAIQNNNYEQVLQLARNLAEATAAVSDAIEAKTAIVTKAFPIAHSQDSTFPARARQATDAAEASTFYRREFLLRVCSYLAGESDEAANKALQSADVALQKTQEAMGLLDGAIERLRSLNVTLPPLLRFTYQIQQVSLTEWRITFTAQNIGGQTSPATNVKFVATQGVTVSPNSWTLPSLASNATQSITIIARTPQRFTNGFGVIRTTLGTEPNDFNVDFVPALVFLTSKDEVPPAISDLTPKEDEIVRTTTPLISATVVDALSGLNVSSLKMTLDGQRVNATYDVATRKFSFRPTQPISEGNHIVVVEATDLDGNTARKQWSFTVRLGAPVEITDLRVSPNPFSPNGDGIDDVLNIRFRLSGEAVLTITVVDSQNRVVKTLANEQQFSQGEHNLTWDGIKDDGQRAETGSYGVRIAIVREGRQQQVVEAQVNADTNPLSITGVSVTPETMRLAKDAATINFNLSQNARVEVKVYMGESTDDDGYVVRSLVMENAQRGSNLLNWDGRADDGRFVPPGVYSIAIEADVGTNSNRVDLAGRITVRSLPDLMAASLISADQDGRTVLTATVRNIGAESARNIVVRFFVRDMALGDKVIASLDSGTEATVEFTIDPTRQVLVDENLALVVDPENSIDELEEFNNRLETRLQIQAVRLAHVLPAGTSLVSVPIQLLDPNPQTAFGFPSLEETKVAWWDPQKQGDVKYRFANEIPALEPGKGYFVKLPSERTLQWTGMPTRTQDGNQYVINLQRGWNLIGLPRPGSVPLNNLTVRRANDQNAIAFTSPQNRLTEPYAWTYSNAERRYQLVYPEVGELGTFDALKGYWVYAHEPCQLLVPAQSRSVYVARKRNQIEGWFFRVEAIAGEFNDSIVIGRNSTRLQAQRPPVSPDGQLVRLSLVDDQGRSWGALVSDGNGRMTFKLLLEAERSVEKVTLRFP